VDIAYILEKHCSCVSCNIDCVEIRHGFLYAFEVLLNEHIGIAMNILRLFKRARFDSRVAYLTSTKWMQDWQTYSEICHDYNVSFHSTQ
jgi:hypothetical protein